MLTAETARPSFVAAEVTDPDQDRYNELNKTYANQVQNTRKNLTDVFIHSDIESDNEYDSTFSAPKRSLGVYLRLRPIDAEMKADEEEKCMVVLGPDSISASPPLDSVIAKQKGLESEFKFTFTEVFDEGIGQEALFDRCAKELVHDAIRGEQCLLFTYGVTSSGKTFTVSGTKSDPGIIPRALSCLFNELERQDRIWTRLNLCPILYAEVKRLSPEQEKKESLKRAELLKNAANCLGKAYQQNNFEGSIMSTDSLESESTRGRALSECSDASSGQASAHSSFSDIANTTQMTENPFEDSKVSIWISFAEVYNELVYDLLADPSSDNRAAGSKKKLKRPPSKICEDSGGNVYVKGLTEVCVRNASEAISLLALGQKNLEFAATNLNHNSSRSHCVFSIRFIHIGTGPNGLAKAFKVNKLSFCDLAGSERAERTDNTGKRLTESNKINTSLLTLGQCIKTLRRNQRCGPESRQIIPYRNSKLTRLLQQFLLGRGKARMIACVNPLPSYFDENYRVLNFCAIAKQVTTSSKDKGPVVSLTVSETVTTKVEVPAGVWNSTSTSFSSSALDLSGIVPGGQLAFPALKKPRLLAQDSQSATDDEATPIAASGKTVSRRLVSNTEKTRTEEESDGTVPFDKYQAVQGEKEYFQQLVLRLQTALEEKNREIFEVETKTREEVVNHYARQRALIEQRYSDKADAGIGEVERIAELNIEDYINTVQKQMKNRGRINMNESSVTISSSPGGSTAQDDERDEDDEWVSAAMYKEQEAKVARLESEIAGLKKEGKDSASLASANTSSTSDLVKGEKFEDLWKKEQSKAKELEMMLEEAGEAFKTKESEIEELKKTISDCRTEMKSLSELKTEMESLRKDLDKSREDIAAREARIAKLEQELKGPNDAGDSSNDAVEIASLRRSLEDKEKELSSLRQHIERLKDTVSEGGGQVGSAEESDLKLIECESRMFDLERERDDSKAQLSALRTEFEAHKSEHASCKDTKERLVSELNTKSEEFRQVEQTSMEHKCALDALKVAHESKLEDLSLQMQKVSSLNDQVQKLSEELEKVKELSTNLKEKLASQEYVAAEVSSKLDERSKEWELKETELNEKICGLESAKSGLESDLAKVNSELQEKDSAIAKFTAQVEQLEGKVQSSSAGAQALEKQRVLAEQRALEANNECTRLSEAMKDMKKEMDDKLKEKSDLEIELKLEKARADESDHKLEAFQSLQAAMQQKIKSMETQKNAQQVEHLEKQILDLQASITDFQDEIAKAKAEKDAALAQLVDKDNEIANREKLIQFEKDNVALMEQERKKDEEAQKKFEDVLKEYEEAKKKAEDVSKQNMANVFSLKQEILQLKQKDCSAMTAIEQYKKEVAMQKVNVQNLQKQLHEASQGKADSEKLLVDFRQKILEYQTSLASREQMNQRLTVECENFRKVATEHKDCNGKLESLSAQRNLFQQALVQKDQAMAKMQEQNTHFDQTVGHLRLELDKKSKELSKQQERAATLTTQVDNLLKQPKQEAKPKSDAVTETEPPKIDETVIKNSEFAIKLGEKVNKLRQAIEAQQQEIDEHKVQHKRKDERIRTLMQEKETLETRVNSGSNENSKVPQPTGRRRTNNARPASATDAGGEEAETVEITSSTPVPSKRGRGGRAPRGRGDGRSRKRTTSGSSERGNAQSRQSAADSSASRISTDEAQDEPSTPRTATKSRRGGKRGATAAAKRENRSMLTEESVPVDSEAPTVKPPLPMESPLPSTGRPSRKAKTNANDAIHAVGLQEHVRSSSPYFEQTASYLLSGATTGEAPVVSGLSEGIPLKKRKRALYTKAQETKNVLDFQEEDEEQEGEREEEKESATKRRIIQEVERSVKKLPKRGKAKK